jgi:uroporphyrinogen decarboxylase
LDKMTSRERVRRALNHQEADRVPIDIGGICMLTTLHRDAYANLKSHLGYHNDNVTISYFPSQCVLPDEFIRQRFHADCYPLYLNNPTNWTMQLQKEANGSTFYMDEWGIKWKCPNSGLYYDPVGHPLKDCTMEDIDRFSWPDPRDPGRVAGLKQKAKELYENTGYSLVMHGALGNGLYVAVQWLIGHEDYFVNTIVKPDLIHALMEKITEYHIAQWDTILDEVGKYIDVVVMSDDLGTQTYPIMNPKKYREMVKPYQARIANFIKEKADVKIVYHCDGAIYTFLPDFVDIGFDALNPVQVTADGMDDTAKLKREFGDKLSFWGAGCDSQGVLSQKSPAEVRDEVARRVNDLAAGGGLILSSIHNIQRDVPAENMVAFYDALYEFGTAAYRK